MNSLPLKSILKSKISLSHKNNRFDKEGNPIIIGQRYSVTINQAVQYYIIEPQQQEKLDTTDNEIVPMPEVTTMKPNRQKKSPDSIIRTPQKESKNLKTECCIIQ